MDWRDSLHGRFPDWQTSEALTRWPEVRSRVEEGQDVLGVVISRAPFGVWLDIGVDWPALLLVPEMKDAGSRRIRFEDYPKLGETVEGWVVHMAEGNIAITQRDKTRMD
jgi:transcriptional accessory protein Tex/SPT6